MELRRVDLLLVMKERHFLASRKKIGVEVAAGRKVGGYSGGLTQ